MKKDRMESFSTMEMEKGSISILMGNYGNIVFMKMVKWLRIIWIEGKSWKKVNISQKSFLQTELNHLYSTIVT